MVFLPQRYHMLYSGQPFVRTIYIYIYMKKSPVGVELRSLLSVRNGWALSQQPEIKSGITIIIM